MSRSAVREAVSSCLKGVLGAGSQAERRAAEQEMKALEVTEDYGAVLAELTASREVGGAYRQLASVLLRQYLDCHWCRHSDKFTEPVAAEQVKAEIRHLLLASIGDRERRLRATIAYGVAVIAHWDWPEEWPQLLPRLEVALVSGDPHLVHGAMRVLAEFCRDVSDLQVPHVAPVVLPQLLRVLVQPQVYSARTVSRAVNIFHTIAGVVYAASETTPTLATSLLIPVLPQFVQAIIFLLTGGEAWPTDHGLRRELLMTSSSLLRWFPAVMATYTMDLVTSVWQIFLANTPLYVASVVNCQDVRSGECDSDGELISMETCVFAVFEFISELVERRALRQLLPPILPTLIFHLISHMQLPHDQVESWMEDVAQFVEEDEQEFSYSVRLSAHDVLQTLWEEPSLKDHTHSAITDAVERHLQTCRTADSAHAWKVQEACMLALSCVAMAPTSRFSVQQFTETVVMPTLVSPTAHPLLLGRCLWLAGKMASQIKPETLQQLLQSLVSALLPTQHRILRVLASKATYYFCSVLREAESTAPLLPVLPSLISLLTGMATTLPDDVVLLVVIDTLQLVARVDAMATAHQSEHLSQVALSLLFKYFNDPGLSSTLEDLFSVLANNAGCHANFHRHFLPSAVQLLDCANKEGNPLALVAAVLDVLVVLVRGCGEGGVPGELVTEVFPRVVRIAVASDDTALLQNAGECVRAFVAMAMEQLMRWVDSDGESGVGYVVRLLVHMLDPTLPEYTAAFTGRLIIVFIKRGGAGSGDHLQLLLRSVLSKMQNVRTASVMQSLLMVYAYLIQNELEAVVSFLCQVPDPHGQPALNYILREWTSQHPFFFGVFETRLSTVALCHLLSHCVATGDQILCGLTFHEDVLNEDNTVGVVTRSQRSAIASAERSKVTLPVKILHLIVSDLQSHLEATAASEEEEEDGSEEGEGVREMEALLRSEEGQWEESEDDHDFCKDPLLQLDMQAHLVQYLQHLCQLSFFSSLIRPHLRQDELLTLVSAGIHVQ